MEGDKLRGIAEVYQHGRELVGCPRKAEGRWWRPRPNRRAPRARSPRIAALPKKALSHFPLSSGHQSLRVRLRQTISVWLTNENPIGNLTGAVARIGITRTKRAIGTSNGRELF